MSTVIAYVNIIIAVVADGINSVNDNNIIYVRLYVTSVLREIERKISKRPKRRAYINIHNIVIYAHGLVVKV